MTWDGPKQRLFRIIGPAGYRFLHAVWFGLRLIRALLSPSLSNSAAKKFFGPDLLAFAQNLPKGGTVLDIGAFLGGSTALFARAVGRQGRVIAFEPVHHRYLSVLIGLSRLSLLSRLSRLWLPFGVTSARIEVEALALADRNGSAELVVPVRAGVPLFSQAGFAESYAAAQGPDSGYTFLRLPTRLERLDDVLQRLRLSPEAIDAVKIDVEGSEMILFAGAENFLSRFRGVLLCEFWFHVMPPPGWSHLRARGFTCRYLDRQGRWLPADTPEAMAELCRGETYGNFLLQKNGSPQPSPSTSPWPTARDPS